MSVNEPIFNAYISASVCVSEYGVQMEKKIKSWVL